MTVAEPEKKICFLCQTTFTAEWGRLKIGDPWFTSYLCYACECKLNEERPQ